MKVRELIEKAQQLDPEADVVVKLSTPEKPTVVAVTTAETEEVDEHRRLVLYIDRVLSDPEIEQLTRLIEQMEKEDE
jgi:hypothetical protein